MKKGARLEIDWVDIQEHSTGDPASAELAERTSVGYFWEARKIKGIECVVTTTTLDKNLTGQNGWCVYPKACIRKMRRV